MSELKAVHAFDVYEAYTKTGDDDAAQVYIKSEADKVIAAKDAEIAGLKAMAKEPGVPNRICRKCGNVGTLRYMPIVKDGHIYWDLYNNKGIDYVFGIRCAHCGEVAFVTRQAHEYELRHHKYKRCLAMAKWCKTEERRLYKIPLCAMTDHERWQYDTDFWIGWHYKWLAIAKKFKEAK